MMKLLQYILRIKNQPQNIGQLALLLLFFVLPLEWLQGYVAYDADDICETYENDVNFAAGLGLNFVVFLGTMIYATPPSIAVSKSGKIYTPLHEKYEMDLVQIAERDQLL